MPRHKNSQMLNRLPMIVVAVTTNPPINLPTMLALEKPEGGI